MNPEKKAQVLKAANDFADVYLSATSEITRDLAYVALQDLIFANPDAFPGGVYKHPHNATLVVKKPAQGHVLRHFFGNGDTQ